MSLGCHRSLCGATRGGRGSTSWDKGREQSWASVEKCYICQRWAEILKLPRIWFPPRCPKACPPWLVSWAFVGRSMKLQKMGRGKKESVDVEPSRMKTGEAKIHLVCRNLRRDSIKWLERGSTGLQHGKSQEKLLARAFFSFKCLTDLGGLQIDRALEYAMDYRYLLFQSYQHKAVYLCPWLCVSSLHF